jgi:UDP-N-acetylmuramyl pentapeptide synthase
MLTWRVTEILQRIQGARVWGDPQQQVHGVSTDARTVLRSRRGPGEVIVLKGSWGMAMERLVHTLPEPEGGG